MKIIGITGGIGSGKSTIAAELRRLGYTVYYCDTEAKRIIVEDADVRTQLITLFGSQIYEGDTYRTDMVAQQVFRDRSLLVRLNAIVHPAVKRDIQNCIANIASQQEKTMFIESAILYESGVAELCDKVILVTAPEEVRVTRCIARDYQGIASEDNINKVRARIRAQKKDADISADIRLNNDGIQSIATLVTTCLNALSLES